MNKELVLFSEGAYHTGVEFEENEYHGDCVVFYQSFPSPMMGHSTEKVMVKAEKIDDIISYLNEIKEQLSNKLIS